MATRRLERFKPHVIYRKENGEVVPGSSTIAGIHKPVNPLMSWAARLAREGKDWRKERDASADHGAIAHFLIECTLSNDTPDLCEFTKEEIALGTIPFESFLKYWEKNKIEVVCQEKQMVSRNLNFGGTLDLVGRDKQGRLILFDWKTSKAVYESHLFQCVSYRKLYEELGEPIHKACIVRVPRAADKPSQHYWVQEKMTELYWASFLARLAVYHADKALMKS